MLIQHLINKLISLTQNRQFIIAYSGGIDSHVLLHALASIASQQGFKIRAIYINHGLQKQSTLWEKHCQAICSQLDLPFSVKRLFLTPSKGESIEAAARHARYQALASILQKNESLLTAQHLDDQAETVLLQLFRGAGSKGLSAMPDYKAFANSEHIRPLLGLSKQVIINYASQHHLAFIEDPSNQNKQFDRNFLRHQIFPQLSSRWPSIHSTLSRVAKHQAETEQLLNHFIGQQYQCIQKQHNAPQLILSKTTHALPIIPLLSYSPVEQKALLRYWIDLKGHPLPSEKKLKQLINCCLHASHDRQPIITWLNTEIRRHHYHLYLLSAQHNTTISEPIEWKNITTPLPLDQLNIILKPDLLKPYLKYINERQLSIYIKQKKGGEKIKISHKQPTKAVKQLLQENKIPVWERGQIPLIYAGKQLIIIYSIASINNEMLISN